MSKKIEVSCEYCGKIGVRYLSMVHKHVYCSRECASKSRHNKISVICEQCGKSFLRYPSMLKGQNHHFCSSACWLEWRRRNMTLLCDWCGISFMRTPREGLYANHFCSSECHSKSRSTSVELACENCGKIFLRNPAALRPRNFCSRECFGARNAGDMSSCWQGGLSFEPYPSRFNEVLKKKIRERDSHICQLCGKTREENGRELSAHHVDYDKTNCDPRNLITLCGGCNGKVNYNREYYTKFFNERIEYIMQPQLDELCKT